MAPSLLLLFAQLSLLAAAPIPAPTTDWDSISTHLVDHWREDLPPIPEDALDISAWPIDPALKNFRRIDANLSTAQLCRTSASGGPGLWPR